MAAVHISTGCVRVRVTRKFNSYESSLYGSVFRQLVQAGAPTGAALIENNEASAKLTTANGRTFTCAQLHSVANHVTARSIGD